MLEAMLSGILLGLSAGFSPGPLLVVVISISLRHSLRDGFKAACAPLLTDLPIIAGSLVVAQWLSTSGAFFGIISLAGGAFVLYLAWETFKTEGVDVSQRGHGPRAIRTGVVVNFLSPHPYIFWFTVGAPQIIRLSVESWAPGIGFSLSFLAFLIGSKMLIAVLFSKARSFIIGRPYIYTMRALGVLLALFGLLLLKDASVRFGLFGG